MTAMRSGRSASASRIALPNANARRGLGIGGRYVFTSSGTIGMSRSPTMNSNGVRNAWPRIASWEYVRSNSRSMTPRSRCVARSVCTRAVRCLVV